MSQPHFMSNKYYSSEFKYEVVKAYKSERYTIRELCSKYKINILILYSWLGMFEKHGINGLEDSKVWKSYSKKLKEAAVRGYLSRKSSQGQIVKEYEISSGFVLRKWIKKYNDHRELKNTRKRRMKSITKGRKTTWKERIQIVTYCLENGKDYKRTADIYEVSYQQVYQ